MKVRDIIRLIEEDGWRIARQKGSHRQYKHSIKSGLVTVPGHPSDEVDPKTQSSILKQARLRRQ